MYKLYQLVKSSYKKAYILTNEDNSNFLYLTLTTNAENAKKKSYNFYIKTLILCVVLYYK